jgi:DMSO/TMAO reductase YedYZ heme-binding membrane subunit
VPAELHSNILAPFKYVLTVDLNFLGIITAGLFALVLLIVSFLTSTRRAAVKAQGRQL